jgi:3-methyl-2-oxobutanoate hydroxymethyltransferase
MAEKITVPEVVKKKSRGEKIVVLTAYDYPTGKIADEAGVDIVLVGDSLGMVVLGFENTIPVTMDIMVHHTAAVARGVSRALIVADMPFMSYQASVEDAVRNAGRLMQEGGAHAVKLEGGAAVAEAVERMVKLGIPVMGHLGMTPQSVHQFGGYKLQGREEPAAVRILEEARLLEECGVFALVLELVPSDLAKRITETLRIPTIGIGAGLYCDGQVQVIHDILGFYDRFVPKHTRRYAEIWKAAADAVSEYVSDVRAGRFPIDE